MHVATNLQVGYSWIDCSQGLCPCKQAGRTVAGSYARSYAVSDPSFNVGHLPIHCWWPMALVVCLVFGPAARIGRWYGDTGVNGACWISGDLSST
jgi:hypothetical protein